MSGNWLSSSLKLVFTRFLPAHWDDSQGLFLILSGLLRLMIVHFSLQRGFASTGCGYRILLWIQLLTTSGFLFFIGIGRHSLELV